ncbi:o-succinylbenzoate synthase [Halobacteriales archaeon QS_5_70_15]|nr:MAG: o-succinylbenzoate synthase [Halobacteriales archaeon QS_5_70_15]
MNVESFALELSRPLSTARGDIVEREGFLVRVERDGETGYGEATPLPGWTESLEECRAALDAVDGDPTALALAGMDGTPAARHGLELALSDAAAHARDEPLSRYLGGEGTVDRVPVNATVGDGPPPRTAREAREAVAEGFPAVKVKVGSRPLDADLDRLAAVREVCPDVELRADANGAWDPGTARRGLRDLAPLDVAYVEQPLPAADLAGHARLRGEGVGVALDESLVPATVDETLAAGAADVLVLKPMALGGPARAREAALRARAAGVEPVVTTTIDGSLARAAAVHVAASVPAVAPCGLATGPWLTTDLTEEDPAPVVDGVARAPSGPGNVAATPRLPGDGE